MLGKNHYHRSFIIFQSKDRGYGFREGKEPAGYCKVEVRNGRGKVYVYVQDLKVADIKKEMYEIVFVSNKGDVPSQSLGGFEIDKSGRGEAIIGIDPSNIGAGKRTLEDYHAIAIALFSQGEGGELSVKFPLVGYSSRDIKIDWTGKVASQILAGVDVKSSNKIDRPAKVEDILSEPSKSQTEPEVVNRKRDPESKKIKEKSRIKKDVEAEKEIGLAKGVESESKKDPSVAEEIEKVKEHQKAKKAERELATQTKQKSKIKVKPKEDTVLQVMTEDKSDKDIDTVKAPKTDTIPYIEESFEEKLVPKIEEVSTTIEKKENIKSKKHKDIYWNEVKEYFTDLLKEHEHVEPFDEYIDSSTWIRVPQFGPHYPYVYNDHYIVGLISEDDNVKYIVYGIPGPYGSIIPRGMDGFYCWKPGKDVQGFGYWLLYIDAENGEVVYPY
ncbi:MAG: hypothetical protein GX974_03070 [Clostridiales bacterium]|nr:hypothetical protein [Clostridiales bacterium]